MVSIVYVRGRAGGEASGLVGHAGTHAAAAARSARARRRRGDDRRALGPLRGALAVGHADVTPGHDSERQLTREKLLHTHSACLSTAARAYSLEKHAPLQSAKRKQLTSGRNSFCLIATHSTRLRIEPLSLNKSGFARHAEFGRGCCPTAHLVSNKARSGLLSCL